MVRRPPHPRSAITLSWTAGAAWVAQAPDTSECTSTFEAITFSTEVPSDLRSCARLRC